MEGITDVEYKFAKQLWKDLKIQNVDQFCDIYMPGDTLLRADVVEGFQNK